MSPDYKKHGAGRSVAFAVRDHTRVNVRLAVNEILCPSMAMNSMRDSEYELSPGNYPGMRYWTVVHDAKQLKISPGRIPWKSVLLVEAFVGGLAFVILYFAYSFVPGYLFALMCIPVLGAVLGCFLLPVMKIRAERAKGDILVYDIDREMLSLPRERMSLQKRQIVEFRLLHDYGDSDEKSPSRVERRANSGAAELQLIYRNPNLRKATLLQVSGAKPFDDVIATLKMAGVARISVVEEQPDRKSWSVKEISHATFS